jgi:hypothetical protein
MSHLWRKRTESGVAFLNDRNEDHAASYAKHERPMPGIRGWSCDIVSRGQERSIVFFSHVEWACAETLRPSVRMVYLLREIWSSLARMPRASSMRLQHDRASSNLLRFMNVACLLRRAVPRTRCGRDAKFLHFCVSKFRQHRISAAPHRQLHEPKRR